MRRRRTTDTRPITVLVVSLAYRGAASATLSPDHEPSATTRSCVVKVMTAGQ